MTAEATRSWSVSAVPPELPPIRHLWDAVFGEAVRATQLHRLTLRNFPVCIISLLWVFARMPPGAVLLLYSSGDAPECSL